MIDAVDRQYLEDKLFELETEATGIREYLEELTNAASYILGKQRRLLVSIDDLSSWIEGECS